MNYILDSKEAYLYGILLEMANQQVTLLDKQLAGKLGLWGKSRLKSRTKEIQKIIFHIFEQKNKSFEEVVVEMMADFDYIETAKTETWNNLTPEGILYLRKILSQLT